MDFLFIGLALGCAIFLFKIISEYMSETPVFHNKIQQADAEELQYETQVQSLLAAKENHAAQVKKVDGEIKALENMRDELKTAIDATKKEMARQGKIVMKRNVE